MRAAIYARVSSDKQEKQATIESQLSDLRQAIAAGGGVVVGEYIDNGYSGELLDRPGLDRLRDDARLGAFEEVWVHCPDRLARKFIYQGLVQEDVTRHGIKVVYFNRPEAKDTPEDRLLENVQGVIAEYEKAKILERTRRGKLHKAERGVPVGGWVPYGYRYVPGDRNKNEDGHIEVMPQEAKVVHLIFRLVARHRYTVRAVARELTRRGIPPQRGKLWRTSTISRILKNQDYPTAITCYNRRMSVEPENGKGGNRYRRRKNTARRWRPRDQWKPIPLPSPPLVNGETFEQAQRQMARNAAESSRNTKHDYLLRKLARCGECDSPLFGSAYHGKLYYVCGNRHRTFPLKKECRVGSFRAGPLEDAVWRKVCEAIADPQLILSQIGKIKERAGKARIFLKTELAAVEKRMAAVGQEEQRVLKAYREEVISLNQLRDQMAEVNEKKARLAEERQLILGKLDVGAPAELTRDNAAEHCKLVQKRLAGLNGDFEEKRRILGLLVNKIVVVGKCVRIRGIIPAGAGEGEGDSGRIASTTYSSSDRRAAARR